MRVPGPAHATLLRRTGVSALLASAALAFGLPAAASADPACPGSDVQPDATDLPQAEAATLCLVNIERSRQGLGSLVPNGVLRSAALSHSQDMVSKGFFSHDSSNGDDFEARIISFRYAPTNAVWVAGENLAWGTLSLSTPDSVVTAWMNSPEHRDNILDGDYKEFGAGIVLSTPEGDPTGATYTTDFGAQSGRVPRAASKPKAPKRHAKRAKHRHRKHHALSYGPSRQAQLVKRHGLLGHQLLLKPA
jgi:uncharacterized protein YkwD